MCLIPSYYERLVIESKEQLCSSFSLLGFNCSRDIDCNKGYCEKEKDEPTGKCVCLDGYQYKEDCSIPGCKFETSAQ